MRSSFRLFGVSGFAILIALSCLFVALAGASGSADAAVGAHRLGVAPRLPAGARRVGHVAAGKKLAVDVTLTVRDQAALNAYATAVATPGSASFHHYLTVAQLRRRFAPSAAQIRLVRTELRRAGLHPGRPSANGLLIPVSATAGALSRAFHTRLARVRLAGGRVAYANTQAPEVDARIANLVQGVVGLNSLAAPHALSVARLTIAGHARANARVAAQAAAATGAATPCQAVANAASTDRAYTADEIASAYGFNALYDAGDFGAGQTVGLLEFEEYSSADVAQYESCYGIDSTVSTTLIDGGEGLTYTGGPSGSGEAALDIDQIIGLAPAAAVDVYEAPDSTSGMLDAFTAMLENPSIKVISTSWGECEYLEDYYDSGSVQSENDIFEEMAAAGKSVFAAAGDDGSYDCYGQSLAGRHASTLQVDDPGSQPDVTSVGGTSLPADTDAAGQTVWNDSSIANGAGGGGISLNWTMPSYQSGAAASLGVINANSSAAPCAAISEDCREVPDVSADADPETGYMVSYEGAWHAFAGTSGAAPLWAALTALANASPFCSTSAVGFANPVLYAVAGTDDTNAFTDVTSGDNLYTPRKSATGLFPATTGYDMASGLGTPNAGALVPDMCTAAAGTGTSSTADGGSVFTGNASYSASGVQTTSTPVTPTQSTPTQSTPTQSTPTASTPTPSDPPQSSPTATTATTPTAPTPTATTPTPSPTTPSPAPVTVTKATSVPSTITVTVIAPRAGQTALSVSVKCPTARRTTCALAGTLELVETLQGGKVVALSAERSTAAPAVKRSHKTVVVARGSLSLRAGKASTLKLSLNATGRNLLRRHGKLALSLHLTNRGTTVTTRTVHFSLTKTART